MSCQVSTPHPWSPSIDRTSVSSARSEAAEAAADDAAEVKEVEDETDDVGVCAPELLVGKSLASILVSLSQSYRSEGARRKRGWSSCTMRCSPESKRPRYLKSGLDEDKRNAGAPRNVGAPSCSSDLLATALRVLPTEKGDNGM